MCKAFLIHNLKNEPIGKKGKDIAIHYFINAIKDGNDDGYFLETETQYLRTLDIQELVDALNKIDTNSSFLAGHCRLATHGNTTTKYIHGWKFGEFSCYHNGIISTTGKAENDSLDFFKSIFNNKSSVIKNIKREFDKRSGSGAFFITSKDKCYLVSNTHSINVHLMGDLMVYNSGDTIHNFKEGDQPYRMIECKTKETNVGPFSFRGKSEFLKINLELNIEDILHDNDLPTSFLNGIAVIDKQIPKEILKLTDKQIGYTNHYHEWGKPYKNYDYYNKHQLPLKSKNKDFIVDESTSLSYLDPEEEKAANEIEMYGR